MGLPVKKCRLTPFFGRVRKTGVECFGEAFAKHIAEYACLHEFIPTYFSDQSILGGFDGQNKSFIMKILSIIRAVTAATVLSATSALHAQISLETVTVGAPGNAADTTGYGSVGYSYNIGKYDVTLTQYTAFLNAVAKSDPYGLYNLNMGSNANVKGILRSGASGNYSYSVIGDGQRPVSYVSWFDAARFCNWLTNGQKTGAEDATTTESGAYQLNGATSGLGIAKNALAQWYIPTENEWYKAAFYDPNKGGLGVSGYWRYATMSDTAPGNSWASRALANEANYMIGINHTLDGSSGYLTPVGAFTDSASAYGTYDQAGNVWNLNDTHTGFGYGLRGGAWTHDATNLSSLDRSYSLVPSDEFADVGFRVAETVPEPCSLVLTGVGAVGLLLLRRKTARK